MSKKYKWVTICDTCGQEMPVDKEKSIANWVVHKTKCECGGKAKIKIEQER